MNIPCDNCKTVRTFSGEPLRCDVCGLERDASSLRGTDVPHRELTSARGEEAWLGEENGGQRVGLGVLLRVGIWVLVIVGAGCLLAQYLASKKHPDILTPGKYQLALKYHLTEDQVFMDPKPKGCDFTDAPLGDKHCHYEQSLNVVRQCLTPNCPVERVYVSWNKVRD